MAAEVQPVSAAKTQPSLTSLTPDQAYWKSFRNQVLIPSPHQSAITSITTPTHNPTGVQAESFAVTSSARVQIYSTKQRKLLKTIGRFGLDDTARSGVLRRDGRILLAAGDSGIIQAFDTSGRAILRQWRGQHAHRLPVHVVKWNPNVLTELMSTSDDCQVRAWELTEDVAKWTGIGHTDYVRAGSWLPDHASMIISGSYDQTVRLWDTRQQQPAMTFKHAAPIESLLPLNSSTIASAAGSEVTILNLTAGKAEHVIRSHQKSVTALSTAQNSRRLLTGGLDGHVKIHDTSTWEVVSGFKYPAPVLSLAVVASGSEDRHLAVGLENGLLSLRTRLAGLDKAKAREKELKMQALVAGEADEYERRQRKKDARQGIRARDRGKDFRGEGADIVITGNERSKQSMKKLKQWQRSLREGKYGLALDQVLHAQAGRAPHANEEVITLLTALRHRSALRTALANRESDQLLPILHWCLRYISHPTHLYLVYDVLLLLLDLYSHKLADWSDDDGEGTAVVRLIRRLEKRVRSGVDLAEKARSMVGMVQLLEAG